PGGNFQLGLGPGFWGGGPGIGGGLSPRRAFVAVQIDIVIQQAENSAVPPRALLTTGSAEILRRIVMRRRDFFKHATAGAAIGLAYKPSRVLGANDRVRLGIIGAGGRGQELIKDFLKVPNIEFVAVADVYKRRHNEAAKLTPGIKPVIDHRRLLDMKAVDSVVVAT